MKRKNPFGNFDFQRPNKKRKFNQLCINDLMNECKFNINGLQSNLDRNNSHKNNISNDMKMNNYNITQNMKYNVALKNQERKLSKQKDLIKNLTNKCNEINKIQDLASKLQHKKNELNAKQLWLQNCKQLLNNIKIELSDNNNSN